MYVVTRLAKWPPPNVSKWLIALGYLALGGTSWVSRLVCTSVFSFCVLAKFVLADWVSGLQKIFFPSALTLRLAAQTNLFHLLFLFLIFQDGPQRKKRKSEVAEVDRQLDILAVGTAVGSILLYSTVKGELQSKLVSNTLFITCYQILMGSVSLCCSFCYSKIE